MNWPTTTMTTPTTSMLTNRPCFRQISSILTRESISFQKASCVFFRRCVRACGLSEKMSVLNSVCVNVSVCVCLSMRGWMWVCLYESVCDCEGVYLSMCGCDCVVWENVCVFVNEWDWPRVWLSVLVLVSDSVNVCLWERERDKRADEKVNEKSARKEKVSSSEAAAAVKTA